MKTLLKIFAALIIIIFALLFILPMVYKSEIISLTKNELNKNVNATINFEDIDLSLFNNFPNFDISIYGLYIIGNNEFKDDTLINIERISMAIDIFSVINSDNYKVKNIKLFSPALNIKVLKNGKANYDISLPNTHDGNASSNNDKDSNTNTINGFHLDIDKFHISNGEINYIDYKLNTVLHLAGIHHTLSGKLNSDKVVLFTNTKVANLNVTYEGIKYLSNVAVIYKASIDADIKNEIFKLGKNELIINELFVNFDGTVSYVEDNLNIILTFSSIGNKFKNILSLVPAIYANNFENIKTEGTFSLNGFIKGTYNDTHIPSFNITSSIDNAMFQYPGLPNAVTNINLKADISNTGGDADNTVIDIHKFELLLGKNPFNAKIKISNPISDPNINAKIIGEIDLAGIKDFYPLDDDELNGNLSFNVKFKGRLSSVENCTKGKTNFIAMGSFLATNINYKTSMFNNPINLKVAQLNFSPNYIDLVSFKASIGENNINATGKINNYLPYYFNTGTLDGSLISNSSYINIDNLLGDEDNEKSQSNNNHESQQQQQQQQTDIESNSIVEIPDNINFTISSQFNKLIYDSLEMDNVSGKLIISNKTLEFQNLIMDAVDGKLTVNGSYSTININKPKVDFHLSMKNLSIPVAYNQFAIIRNYLPLAKKTTGLFSANFSISTVLDSDMMPKYSTMNGSGNLSTTKISINNLNSLTQIAESLNLIKFRKLEIDKIHINFEFVNGKLIVKPTTFKYQNIDAELEGWTGFDKSIGYTLDLEIPRSEFGEDANKILDGLLSQVNSYGANFSVSDIIPISISIDGTLDNPKISSGFNKTKTNTIIEKTKETISKEIEKEKEKLSKEAAARAQQLINDADKQAKQLIKEAEKQARLIKKNATDTKKNLLDETDKQTKTLIAEGKKNGFIAEMAAKEAAKQLKDEAERNADYIVNEANKNADNLIKEAKTTAKKLKADAEKNAKKVRGE